MQAMRERAHDYAVDEATPAEVRALYEALDAHEKDLIRHMHLEGNVVFPRAERLEVKVRSQAPRGSRRSV
jgi:iron-sulfur cluster repair protein YtfE (RIC family)